MGIPRLTQDLQPYLEDAVLSANDTAGVVLINNLVIDGPSMVYHVYNRLLSHRLAEVDFSKIFDVPSYSLLNEATQKFLGDIEARGVKIRKILFDGALPEGKRHIRAERLEKSRRALELYRAAYPTPNLCQQSFNQELSQALWTLQPRNVSTEITAPFIVPSVLENLRSSKWSKDVFVVPGEADSFCAYEARQEHAAILTNDSDLVLFEEVETVVPLNSLMLDQAQSIRARCWRPQKVAEQCGIPTMSHLGFARARNARVSFNVVVQIAREIAERHHDDFQTFRKEFDPKSGMSLVVLDDLDPRFAEIVYQLSGATEKPEITLPVLLEDSSRDASWSYGKDIRRLAYSVLVKHFTSSRPAEIIEYTRKGPAITATTFGVLQDLDFDQCAQRVLHQMKQYPLNNACSWVVYALHEVWSQRVSAGRSVFTGQVLSILLGLVPLPVDGRSTNMWDVMHLNANIQAVLYSTRLLKQAMNIAGNSRRRALESNKLVEVLDLMPTIEKIFLTPVKTRETFTNMSRDRLRNLLLPFTKEFDLAGILGIYTADKARSVEVTAHDGTEEVFIVAESRRKRRKKHTINKVSENTTPSKSQNIFDVLSSAN